MDTTIIKPNKIDLSHSKLLDKYPEQAEAVSKMLSQAQEKGAVNEVRRLKFICDHYTTLTPDTAYYWFDLEALQREIEEAQARKAEPWHTWRNRLSLAPLILTWVALALAVFLYQQDLNAHPNDKTFPFLLLWQNGFNNTYPISIPFTFTALLDVFFLIAYLFCLIKSQKIERDAYITAEQFAQNHQKIVEDLIRELDADGLPSILASTDVNEVARTIKETVDAAVDASKKAIQGAKEAFEKSASESKDVLMETQRTFREGIGTSTKAIESAQKAIETLVTTSQMAIEEHKLASLTQLEEAKEASHQLIQESRDTSAQFLKEIRETSLLLIEESKQASRQALQEVVEATNETIVQVLKKAEQVIATALGEITASTRSIAHLAEILMKHLVEESKQGIEAAEKRMEDSDKRMQALFDVQIEPMIKAFHKDIEKLHTELERYQERLESLTQASQKLAHASEVLVSNAQTYMETGQAIKEQIGELSRNEQGVLAQITEVATGIKGSVEKMGMAVDGMRTAADRMNTATEAIKGVTDGLSEGMTQAIDRLVTGTNIAAETMLSSTKEVTITIHSQAVTMLNSTEKVIDSTITTMTNRVERATTSLNQAGNILRTTSDQLQITTDELHKVAEKLENSVHPVGFGGLVGTALRRGLYRKGNRTR